MNANTQKEAQQFLDDIYVRSIATVRAEGDKVWCTSVMDDQNLKEGIIQDILTMTMWEVENHMQLSFNASELTRFVDTVRQVQRVERALNEKRVQAFLVPGTKQLRIRPEMLQAAMDYCGVWYQGYEMPKRPDIFGVNIEKVTQAVEHAGGIDNLAKSLAMDMESDHSASEMMH